MQVSIVQEVHMIGVLNGGVATVGVVRVIVTFMGDVLVRHGVPFKSSVRRQVVQIRVTPSEA